jgi:hypothetical protein
MTKGSLTLRWERVVGETAFFIPLGAAKEMKNASVQQLLSMEPLPSPLSSRAKPNFLLHRSHRDHLCGSP